MTRAYIDAIMVVVVLVVGSLLANAYTQSVIDGEAEATCVALLDEAACD